MPRKLCKKSNKLVRNANLLAGVLLFLIEIVPTLKGETEEGAGNQVFPDAAHFVEDGIEGQSQAHEDQGRHDGFDEILFHKEYKLIIIMVQ